MAEASANAQSNCASQFEIPKFCKAGCVQETGPNFTIAVEDVPVPQPGSPFLLFLRLPPPPSYAPLPRNHTRLSNHPQGPDELLIRLNTTGLCYSDLHYMLEDLSMPRMSTFSVRSPGHEGAGVVVALGSGVTNWALGDRAGIKPMWSVCGSCELCWDGVHETYCEKAVATGLMTAGTYQQYITSPANYTTRIPDGVDDETAGPIMCSGSTMYRSLVESGLKAGDWAVFPGGGGGVGHMGVQLAKAMGLRVIVIDGGEAKRELSLRLGAEHFVDFTQVSSVEAEVLRLTSGKGAHGIFVTATSAGAYKSAPMMARTGGKVMCVGLREFLPISLLP